MIKKALNVGVQVGFGALALTAIAVQLDRHIGSGFSVVNFFSYFTNLANLFAAVVLLAGAVYAVKGRACAWYETVRGASVLCMAIVGIVFSIALRNEDLGALLPWVNVVLHYVMPVVVVLYWFVRPPRAKIGLKKAAAWLVFPAVYVTYSLIRGAATGWYAYLFINPDKSGGYARVALNCVAILAAFLILGAVLVQVTRRTSKTNLS